MKSDGLKESKVLGLSTKVTQSPFLPLKIHVREIFVEKRYRGSDGLQDNENEKLSKGKGKVGSQFKGSVKKPKERLFFLGNVFKTVLLRDYFTDKIKL